MQTRYVIDFEAGDDTHWLYPDTLRQIKYLAEAVAGSQTSGPPPHITVTEISKDNSQPHDTCSH